MEMGRKGREGRREAGRGWKGWDVRQGKGRVGVRIGGEGFG